MLSPALFGLSSYDDIVDALYAGTAVESDAAGICLEPVSKETFTVSTLYRKDKNTRIKEKLDVSFRLTVRDLKLTVRSAACNQFLRGEYDGFQVVNSEGESVAEDAAAVFDYNEASALIDEVEGEAYMVPIPQGRSAVIKRLAPVFGEIKVLSDVVQGAYDGQDGMDEGHKELAQYGLNIVGALDALGLDLQQEKLLNQRARKLRDAGKEPMTIASDEYDDLYKHAATLKAMLADPRFETGMHEILSSVEVEELDESGQFDPLTLLNGRGLD